MRTIGVVTVGRSDYSIYLPILRSIQAERDLRLHLIVSGMHLSPDFGLTVTAIREDGFQIKDQIEMLIASDTPEGISKSFGLGVVGFAQSFAHLRPDILLVLGDRFEMAAAAIAALPFNIPLAHIHGGELTEGAIDNALRHMITKLAHLHFVSTGVYARRVIQMGEEPWRVIVCGAPSLDNLQTVSLLNADQLNARFGLHLDRPPLLVTFHPTTLEYEHVGWQVGELLAALETSGLPVVFTLPNADTGGRTIINSMRGYVRKHTSAQVVDNLGTQGYASLMALAVAMVGNSSSGIIEAASFGLPVVNIGTRQQGRIRPHNVIDVGYRRDEIASGLSRALNPSFRSQLAGMTNPYHADRPASQLIVERLRSIDLDYRLLAKHFYDVSGTRQ